MRPFVLSLFVFLAACQFDFSRELEPGDLRGRAVVADETGALSPAADVLVRVEGSGITVRADALGHFVLRNLPPGNYSLRIEQGTTGGLRLRNVQLDNARHLGDVIVGGLGSMTGALSRAGEAAEGRVVLAGVKDARTSEGQWRIEKLLPGDYEVFVTDVEGRLYQAPSVTIVAREGLRLDIDLATLEVITTGQLHGHARLATRSTHERIEVFANGAHPQPTLTNAQGFFSEGGLPAGVYGLRVSHPGYRTLSLPYTVIAPDVALSDLVLIPATESCELGGIAASDTDRDGDGVADADEPEVCLCHPGHEDLDDDGVCDDPDAEEEPVVDEDAEPFICNGAACVESPRLTAAGKPRRMGKVPGTERVIIALDNDLVIETDGTTWTHLTLPADAWTPQAIHARSATQAWLVDSGGRLFTRVGNAFVFVAQVELDFYSSAHSVWGLDDAHVWVGTDLGLSFWNGSTLELVSQVSGAVRYIGGTSVNDLWVGTEYVLHHWNGSSWTTPMELESPVNIATMWVSNAGVAWVVESTYGRFEVTSRVLRINASLQIDQPGDIEIFQTSGEGGPQATVALDGEGETPWFVSNEFDRNNLRRWEGSEWKSVAVTSGLSAYGEGVDAVDILAVSSPSLAWATTNDGALLRWTGTDWTRLFGDERWAFVGIAARASNDVVALDALGNVWHWNGTKWQAAPKPPSEIRQMGAAAAGAYALTADRQVFEWTGSGWTSRFAADPNEDVVVDGPCFDWVESNLHVAGAGDVYVYGNYEVYDETEEGCLTTTMLFRWHDGALTRLPPLDDSWFRGMSGPSSNLWTLNDDTVRRLGGDVEELEPNFYPQSLWAGSEKVYVVANTGRLAVRQSNEWSYIEAPPRWSSYSSPIIWGAQDDDVFVCDTESEHAYRTDGTGPVPFTTPLDETRAIGGLSSTDVWFAGSTGLYHLDGANWTVGKESVFERRHVAVSAYSAQGAFTALETGEVLARDGNGRWSSIGRPLTDLSYGETFLKATSATDVWLVGTPRNDGVTSAHWDGLMWSIRELARADDDPLRGLWTDASGEAVFLLGSGARRWNRSLSDFESVTNPDIDNGWAAIDGADLSSLRLVHEQQGTFLWSEATQQFETDQTGLPDGIDAIASFSKDEFVVRSSSDSTAFRYTTAEGWAPVATTGLASDMRIHSVSRAGDTLWARVVSDDYRNHVARLGTDGWEVFATALPNSSVSSFEVVDGVAWFIQNMAVVRLDSTVSP